MGVSMRAPAQARETPMSKIEVKSSAHVDDGCENTSVEFQGQRPDVIAREALGASMHAKSGNRAAPLAPVQSPRDSMTGFKRGLASCHLIDRIWPFDRILPCRDTPSRKNVDGFEAQPVE